MKVIFIKDLKGVGRKNDVKEQPDGYARNFLIPKGFVIPATAEAIRKVERSENEIRVVKEVQTDLFKKNIARVNGVGVNIKGVANDKGHLFKAIHAKDIVAALKKEHQITMAEEFVHLSEPIKNTGTFTVTVEAMGLKEPITVNVI